MKRIISLLLVFIFTLFFSGCAVKNDVLLTKSTVNVSAHYLDQVFMNTLSSLELIAKTPEAKSVDWEGVKSYLEELKNELPGVYFLVLPDGNYYSVSKDFTNLNLSSREYFEPLFAGEAILGHPIYSRSTSKRSALMAAPIILDGEVVAAFGASVFLDELHLKINKYLSLPENYQWLVLDADGYSMLNNESDYILMNFMEFGSESFKNAMTLAFENKSGVMKYEMDGKKTAYYSKLTHLDWWLIIAKQEGKIPEHKEKMILSLDRFVPELKESLNKIDASTAKCINETNTDWTSEEEIRDLLKNILDKNQGIFEATFITLEGILRYIEPADYKNFENSDISMQEHVIALRKDPKPVFSTGFEAVEGFLAVDLAYPVYDKDNKLLASISLPIRPELLVKPLLKKSMIPDDYELWIMQTDGMIIFDQDQDEIGKILFSDPMYAKYESLLALGKKISANTQGEGSYVYLATDTDEKMVKNVMWQTLKFYECEWRVVLGYKPYKK
ncbi:MAG: cache domain-containing protein [Candidatus Neomarinimicrobiota bacterium]